MVDTTMTAPLTRREAREIERSTGRRPVAVAVAPVELGLAPVAEAAGAVFDTGEIERNSVTSLVSVVPTEVVSGGGVPVPVVGSDVEVPEAFVRSASIRAARPAALVARQRRRTFAGVAVAASAAALATAGAVIPAQSAAEEQAAAAAQADLLAATAGQQAAAAPQAAPVQGVGVQSADFVAAPEQVQAGSDFSVTVFSADQVTSATATTAPSTGGGSEESAASASSGGGEQSSGSTQTASTSGSGYTGSTVVGDSVVETAMQFQGVVPYGNGNSPDTSFDCSGFVQYVYAQHGISLPRTVSGQAAAGTVVTDPQPGDLVVFGSYHIGIYIGNGMMIDAPDWGRYIEVGGLDAGGTPVFVRI